MVSRLRLIFWRWLDRLHTELHSVRSDPEPASTTLDSDAGQTITVTGDWDGGTYTPPFVHYFPKD